LNRQRDAGLDVGSLRRGVFATQGRRLTGSVTATDPIVTAGRRASAGDYAADMAGKRKQRRCRICRKRPPWRYKNCPPGICKRCYHKHVWAERPSAHQGRGASTDPACLFLTDHGYLDDDVVLDDLPDWFV
jgi:hypothetical protein